MEAIRLLNLRLDRTVIESESWEKCLARYDRPSTFFFLDPPYTECEAGMYASWTTADVVGLRERLTQLKGKWLVTLNDCASVRAVFSGCKMKGITRAKGIDARHGAKEYRELVITPS